MPNIRDELIVSCLIDEDESDCDEVIRAENDCEPDRLSIASDHQSEEDAEDVNLGLADDSRFNVQLHCSKSRSHSSKVKPASRKRRISKKSKIPTTRKQKPTHRCQRSKKDQTQPSHEPDANTSESQPQDNETENNRTSSRQSNTSDDIPLSRLIQNTQLAEPSSSQQRESSSSVNYFVENPVRTNVRTTNENIITEVPGVKSRAKGKKSHLECFELFFV